MQPCLYDRTLTRRTSTSLVRDLDASEPLRAAPGSTCLRQPALGALLLSLSISRRCGGAALYGLTGVRATNMRDFDISGLVRRAQCRARLYYRQVPGTRLARTRHAATQTRQDGLYGSKRLRGTVTLDFGAPGRLRRASAPDLGSHSPFRALPPAISRRRGHAATSIHICQDHRTPRPAYAQFRRARTGTRGARREAGWSVFPRHAAGLCANSRTSLRRRGAFLARIRARVRSDSAYVATRDFGVPRVPGRRSSGGSPRDLFPFSCM